MPVRNLIFRDQSFIEMKEDRNKEKNTVLEINTELKEAKLTFSKESSLIDQRTAQRQAESICKVGFLLKTGERIGKGSALDLKEVKEFDEKQIGRKK